MVIAFDDSLTQIIKDDIRNLGALFTSTLTVRNVTPFLPTSMTLLKPLVSITLQTPDNG